MIYRSSEVAHLGMIKCLTQLLETNVIDSLRAIRYDY